jgi:hypothetical protein
MSTQGAGEPPCFGQELVVRGNHGAPRANDGVDDSLVCRTVLVEKAALREGAQRVRRELRHVNRSQGQDLPLRAEQRVIGRSVRLNSHPWCETLHQPW